MGNAFIFRSDVDLGDEVSMAACFEKTRPLLEELNARQLLPVTMDAVTLGATVIGKAAGIRKFRDKAALLPEFDVVCMDVLEERAYALVYAHRVYVTTIQPDGNLPSLNLEASQTRERLLADVRALITNGVLDSGILSEYSGRRGYRPVAEDLALLAGIFRRHWAMLEGQTLRTTAELDRAEALSSRIVRLFGERGQADAEVSRWMGYRQRAYTLLHETYAEARSAIVFLRRRAHDADTIAPSLYVGRKRKSSQGEV